MIFAKLRFYSVRARESLPQNSEYLVRASRSPRNSCLEVRSISLFSGSLPYLRISPCRSTSKERRLSTSKKRIDGELVTSRSPLSRMLCISLRLRQRGRWPAANTCWQRVSETLGTSSITLVTIHMPPVSSDHLQLHTFSAALCVCVCHPLYTPLNFYKRVSKQVTQNISII